MDTKVYIDKDQNDQMTVYHKETDHQGYLHSTSEHPLCIKKGIPLSQALTLKPMCSTITVFGDESSKLTQKSVEQG